MLIDRILDPVFVTLLFAFLIEGKPTGTTQARLVIPSIPGVVPVYIRTGDTPLRDINQDLAEAFDFNAIKHGRLAFGRDINSILNENGKSKENLSSLNEKNELETKEDSQYTHVQKIPRL